MNCVILKKYRKLERTDLGPRKLAEDWVFYSILGIFDVYDPEMCLENQSDLVYDI